MKEFKYMNLKVDAIITTYNEPADNINITILSCLNQSVSFNNIYVVDDGSTYSPEKKLVQDSRVIYLQLKENIGISAARNIALNISTTPYVAIINVDIELNRNWLLELLNNLNSNPNIGAAFGKLFPITDSLISKWRMRFHEQHYYEISGVVEFAPGHAVLFEKDKLVRINFYNDHLKLVHEDADICLRLKKIAIDTYYNSKISTISHQKDTICLISKKHFIRLTFGKLNTMPNIEFLKNWVKDLFLRLTRNTFKLRWYFLPLDIIISIRCISYYYK